MEVAVLLPTMGVFEPGSIPILKVTRFGGVFMGRGLCRVKAKLLSWILWI
jgi:hypothetical protein